MKRSPRHPGSLTLRPAIALVSLCAGGVLLTPTAASADGTYRWQGERSRNYLEILQSSTANQARVIVWPDQGSYNQWWSDFKQVSDGYYRLVNYNSQKSLDRYDGHNGSLCWGYQYDWTGQNWQHWRHKSVWSNHFGRTFDLWINKEGCNGNPYDDTLMAWGSPIDNDYQTYLRTEEFCTEGSFVIPDSCYWRRNGQ